MPRTTLLRKQVTPTGTIQPHAGGTAPDGFLVCDGSIVNIADYPKLYAVIGTSWGHGNEVSPGVSDGLTFHLPDLRGRFLRGVDNGAGRDSDASIRTAGNAGGNTGDSVGSVQGDAIRNITASVSSRVHGPDGGVFSPSSGAFYSTNADAEGARGYTFQTNYKTLNFDASIQVPTGSDNRPRNVNVTYIIKVE